MVYFFYTVQGNEGSESSSLRDSGVFSACLACFFLQVNVFGFGADQAGNWHHYWEENLYSDAFKETGVHDADFEYNITQTLAQKGKIRMYKGV